jgi:hypothetical protein
MDKLVLVLRKHDVVNALRRLKPMEENYKLPLLKALSIPHDVGRLWLVVLMRPSIEGSGVMQVVQFVLF